MVELPDLNYARFEVKIVARTLLELPPFKGSTLRGGFGNAFRRAVCVTRKRDCDSCILRDNCVYSYVFETPVPEGAEVLKKMPRAPHPFVLEPPLDDKRRYEPGEALEFGIILMGRGIQYLPYFILAFEMLGDLGLGRNKGKFSVAEVRNGQKIIYSGGKLNTRYKSGSMKEFGDGGFERNDLEIEFLTPTRMLFRGERVDVPEFHVIVRNLLRRLHLLNYFHGNEPYSPDFKGIIRRAEDVKLKKAEVRADSVLRYSRRQDRKVSMYGFTGKFTYSGEIRDFLPLLKAGEVVHIGKATAFGFGKYKIREV